MILIKSNDNNVTLNPTKPCTGFLGQFLDSSAKRPILSIILYENFFKVDTPYPKRKESLPKE